MKWTVVLGVCAHMHIHTEAVTISNKEIMSLGESGKGVMGDFEGGKGREKYKLYFQKLEKWNYVVCKKIKCNIFSII